MAISCPHSLSLSAVTPEYDSQKYRTAVKEQLKKDIDAAQPHITDLINKKGLMGRI